MVTLGVDAHKHTHTIVAVDEVGRSLAEKTVAATPAGHLEALRWAAGKFEGRQWAMEDCRHLSRRFESDLLRAGEAVRRVHPKLMARERRSGRDRGKSDPIDALAVARAALRDDLPVARLDGPERELRLLLDHREDLVTERTRMQNRLRWHLHELMPGWEPAPGSLDRYKTLDEVAARLAEHCGVVAELAAELVEHIRTTTRRAKELEREIERRTRALAPALLALEGCGPLSAAKLVGETAGVGRFAHRGAFARHNGTAPVPAWSGNPTRHRLNRGGNRQLNAALHRIAITQIRLGGPAKEYVERRMAMGNSKTEAIRALRRRISDEVYRRLGTDETARKLRHSASLSAAA
jgi:transposase